jgi:2-polyprenyl-6-methoxyphenol hydroxylase-like FAD-dependent oxidoreductase
MIHDVAIIGGGVAGAATAVGFTAGPTGVVLFERRDLARDPNRGDVIHPHARDVLRSWGALEALRGRGAFDARHLMLTDATGLLRARFRTFRRPALMLNHAEIELGLLGVAAARGALIRNEAVRAVRREAGEWTIETGNGPPTQARLLVGADGAGSLVRRAADIEVSRSEYRHVIVVLHADRPLWLRPDALWLSMHPAGPLLFSPTTPAGRCRVITVVPVEEAARWKSAAEPELRRWLAERNPRWCADLNVERRGGSHVYHPVRQHARRYVSEGLALVGDAAHTTHPFGGQGMNLAIADAAALTSLVGPVLAVRGNRSAVAAGLRRYERRRQPRNALALMRADLGARFGPPGLMPYLGWSALLAFVTPLPLLPWRIAFPL